MTWIAMDINLSLNHLKTLTSFCWGYEGPSVGNMEVASSSSGKVHKIPRRFQGGEPMSIHFLQIKDQRLPLARDDYGIGHANNE